MRTTTTHHDTLADDLTHKESYRILDYPSGNLLSVDIGDGDVLMDREQAVALLEVLQQAVPALLNANQETISRLNANNP